MFGDTTVVNPFGLSLPNYVAKFDFGVQVTNRSATALSRGDVVMPALLDAGSDSLDATATGGATSIWTNVDKPLLAADLFAALYWPALVVTTDTANSGTVAEGSTCRVWDGGKMGAVMQVAVYYDNSAVLPAGTPLVVESGEHRLIEHDFTVATGDRTREPVAMTATDIPIGAAAAAGTYVIPVIFKGRRF